MTTTDFEAWLRSNGPDTELELSDLMNAVRGRETWGSYSASLDGKHLLVTGWTGEVLKLTNKKAEKAFLRELGELHVDDENDLDASYRFASENPRA
jgi:hypothetical protein